MGARLRPAPRIRKRSVGSLEYGFLAGRVGFQKKKKKTLGARYGRTDAIGACARSGSQAVRVLE